MRFGNAWSDSHVIVAFTTVWGDKTCRRDDKHLGAPFIFVTGSLGEEMTIQALKSGATDFILKHRLSTLPPAIHRALRQAEFRQERKKAEEALLSSEEKYRVLVELSPDALNS